MRLDNTCCCSSTCCGGRVHGCWVNVRESYNAWVGHCTGTAGKAPLLDIGLVQASCTSSRKVCRQFAANSAAGCR